MRQLFKSVACAAVMCLGVPMAAAAGAQPEKVSLKPNWTPGYETKLIMETTREVKLEVTPPGGAAQESTSSGSHTIEMLMKVERSDKNGAVVKLRIDRIEVKAKTIRGEFEWKSTDPRTAGDNANRALAAMRPALGATLTIELDTNGNVTKTDNGGLQVPAGDLADLINIVVSTHDIRNRWGPILSPRKADFEVEVGQSWNSQDSFNRPPYGVFTIQSEYSLKTATDAEAGVGFTGKYSLDAAPDSPQKLFDVTASDVKGSITWDRKLGMFKTYEMEQRVELRGNAQGFPMVQRTHTIVKVRREEADGKPAQP